MKGRLENKIKLEAALKEKIKDAPEYMIRYFYYLSNKTHATKKTYLNNVIRFVKYVGDGEYPDVSVFESIDGYRIQLFMSEITYVEDGGELKEIKASTKCAIYSSLSSFFAFLSIKRNGVAYISHNPFLEERIERPEIEEPPITYLTPDEVRLVEKTILEGVGNATSVSKQKDWKYRDLLLFRIPVINGLRVTALSEISVQDIDFERLKIKVTEKRNITKEVDFDPKTAQFLKLWISQRERLLGDEQCDALFISNRRTRMTARSVERIIIKYTDACIEGKHISPHKLRATCATNTYMVTKDVLKSSKVLGHKTTAPTRRYVAVLEKDITETINAVASLY